MVMVIKSRLLYYFFLGQSIVALHIEELDPEHRMESQHKDYGKDRDTDKSRHSLFERQREIVEECPVLQRRQILLS